MMLNLNMKHKTNRANKLIQHIFLRITCQVHGNFQKGRCDLAMIPMASPFLHVFPSCQKGNLSVRVDSKLNLNSVMWLQKKKKGTIIGFRLSSSKGAVVRQILTLIGILFDYKFHQSGHSVGLADQHIPITQHSSWHVTNTEWRLAE